MFDKSAYKFNDLFYDLDKNVDKMEEVTNFNTFNNRYFIKRLNLLYVRLDLISKTGFIQGP